MPPRERRVWDLGGRIRGRSEDRAPTKASRSADRFEESGGRHDDVSWPCGMRRDVVAIAHRQECLCHQNEDGHGMPCPYENCDEGPQREIITLRLEKFWRVVVGGGLGIGRGFQILVEVEEFAA